MNKYIKGDLITRWPFRCVDYRCKGAVYWWNHFHVLPFIDKTTSPCGHKWDCIIYADELMKLMEAQQ